MMRIPIALALLLLPLLAGACASGGPHKQVIRPAGGGSPLFSPVVRSGNTLYLSGVIGRSQEGDIGAATRQAMDQVRARLETAGATMADILKCTVFMVDMDDYAGMNEAYVEYFPTDPPARTAIAVRGLPANAQIEVECIAAAR